MHISIPISRHQDMLAVSMFFVPLFWSLELVSLMPESYESLISGYFGVGILLMAIGWTLIGTGVALVTAFRAWKAALLGLVFTTPVLFVVTVAPLFSTRL